MTRRDQFAAAALSAIVATNPKLARPQIAKDAYEIADAMLAAADRHFEFKSLAERIADDITTVNRSGADPNYQQLVDTILRQIYRFYNSSNT